MIKSGLKLFFEIHQAPSELLLPSEKKIAPKRLNWPGMLAGIFEGLSEFQNEKF